MSQVEKKIETFVVTSVRKLKCYR